MKELKENPDKAFPGKGHSKEELPTITQRLPHQLFNELKSQLLRQRRHGEFLCHPQAGAHLPLALPEPPADQAGHLRVHPRVVQSQANPFFTGLLVPVGVRK
jgi:hypothetical protein